MMYTCIHIIHITLTIKQRSSVHFVVSVVKFENGIRMNKQKQNNINNNNKRKKRKNKKEIKIII